MSMSKIFPKPFTIRSANQMLPLVQSITADIVQASEEVQQTRARLDWLNEGRVADRVADVYGKEVFSIEESIDRKVESIEWYLRELTELDLMSGRIADGFVDFPAMRKSEPICLCWQLGEQELLFWHGFTEDCSKRRPLDLELIRQSGDHAFV